jgi:hypothetical protein
MPNAPDINVRLTADGVQDVVNAFRRVQQEAKSTREETGLLGQAWAQMGELIPVVTIGVAIEKMVEMGKRALESAVSIGKLAEKTGASVGTLSVLVMAAHDVGVAQDEVSTSLVKLARNQEQATQGSTKSKLAFQSLGISMADIKSKNPADLFVEIAQKLQQMPDGATKAAASMQLFGKSGANLIPVLNELGANGGFDEAKDKAQRLGLYLSDDFVAQAKAGEEALKNMEDVTNGFAMQFMAGFIPEASKAMNDFSASVSSGGTSAFKEFGDFVGNVGRGIINVFLTVGQTIAVIFESILQGAEDLIGTLDRVGQATQKSDWRGAWNALKEGAGDFKSHQASVWGEYGTLLKNEWTGNPPAIQTPKPSGKGGGGSGTGDSDADRAKKLKEFQKLVDARAAYEDQVSNDELKKQKSRDAIAEAEDKAAYDAGLLTLDQYYNARAARISSEADAEQAILKKKLDNEEAATAQLLGKSVDFVKQVVAQGPAAVEAAAGANVAALAMLTKVEQTKAQIDDADLQRQKALAANDSARQLAQVQANDQLLSDRQKLYQLEGNTSAAQQLALERELAQTEELLIKLGVAEDERVAILARAAANANARNQISQLTQTGENSFSGMQNAISGVQDKAASGAISEVTAEAQILAIEKQRLPGLQAIADKMQDVLDSAYLQLTYLQPGTDAYTAQLQVVDNLQRQADEYSQKVASLAAGLQNVKSLSVELSNQLQRQGGTAVVDFFDAIGTGSKTASAAFGDMLKSFEQMIVHMIDQMLVYYALMALVGWAAPNSGFFKSLSASGPFSGLTGHSEGGYTGNVAPNKVAGLVHGKEFVFSAPATQKWGLPLLEAMNAGQVGSIATPSTYSSMGGGGGSAAGADAGGPMVEVNIDSGGQPASASQRTGPQGQSIIDIVVGQVAGDISSGGKVGQAIQSTYGVSRKGNVRG